MQKLKRDLVKQANNEWTRKKVIENVKKERKMDACSFCSDSPKFVTKYASVLIIAYFLQHKFILSALGNLLKLQDILQTFLN